MRDRNESHNGKAFRIVFILVIVLVAGLMTDMFTGLPLIRSTKPWTVRLLGILVFGTIYLRGEAAVAWIGAPDNIADSRLTRALHFILLLGFVVAFCVALGLSSG